MDVSVGDSPVRPGGPSRPEEAPAGPAPATDGLRYTESLRTPWWWYLVSLGVAALLAAEFRVAGLHLTVWIPFCTMLPLSLGIVYWLGRSRLDITADEIRIRGAKLPLSVVTGSVALDARTLRLVVGREGDPAAYVSIRPWIGPGVQVWIDDEQDPTPYWVLSTRHPDHVVSVLRSSD